MLELAIAAQAGVPAIIWGGPGEGKTSYISAFGKALGLPVETVIASIREPSDFSGLPVAVQHHWVTWASAAMECSDVPAWLRGLAAKALELGRHTGEGSVELAPPSWAKRLTQAGQGILFLDEISTAPPAVQAALLRVVLDGFVGDLELPPNVLRIAAANPPEQAAGGWDLTPPLANRFCHLNWHLRSDEWVEGMTRGWPTPVFQMLPSNWEERIPAARALVASYIQHRPDKLKAEPKDDTAAGKAWASPRTWDMASRLLAAAKSVGAGQDTELRLVAGCIGEADALEFHSWQRDLNLPNPEDLLRNPKLYVHPERGDVVFAVLNSVISALSQHNTNDRWLAAWQVLQAAADAGGQDIAAAAGRTLVKCRKPEHSLPMDAARSLLPLMRAAGAVQGSV